MNNSYCNHIKEEYNIEELNSATLTYRIDGFINACNMDLDDCFFTKEISIMNAPYINTNKDENGVKYNINFSYQYDRERGKSYILNGDYNNLEFVFTNYYNGDKNKNKINEIPFWIVLNNKYNGINYTIKMETTIDTMVKLSISKHRGTQIDKLTFYANIDDFSNALKLIRSFVNDPENVFVTYNRIMETKEVIFTGSEFKKGIVKDEELDMPMSKTRKKIKSILNNH